MLKSASEAAPHKHKRWPDTRGIQAINALFMPASSIEDDPNVEEIDDFQSKEDKEYRIMSEKEKPKVAWHIERNCFLSANSNAA